MRQMKEVIIPASKSNRLDFIKCELCGVITQNEGFWLEESGNWTDKSYAIAETMVAMKIGSNYPEGGSAEITAFDICPQCFEKKLIPWLIENGAKVRKEERDW